MPMAFPRKSGVLYTYNKVDYECRHSVAPFLTNVLITFTFFRDPMKVNVRSNYFIPKLTRLNLWDNILLAAQSTIADTKVLFSIGL